MGSRQGYFVLLSLWLCMALATGGCSREAKESVAKEAYPVKPITLIVPFAAGGGDDIMARALERTAKQHLSQPFVIVNKPGGAGTIGMNELAGVQADGYTIGTVGLNVILQPLYGPTRYHYATALEPLVKVVSTPMVVAVLADQPWRNLGDLVEYAKEHPGELKFGHSGLGTARHITGEMLARETGIKLVQVPFKGDAEALTALLGGHVQLILTTPALKEHLKNGSVRILGVAEAKRLTIPGFENVPTFREQGINVALSFWSGLAAPKGITAVEKARLTAGLKEMINDPEFKKNMEDIGMAVDYLGPDEFSDEWIAENPQFTKIVKETGIIDLIAAQKN